MKQLFVPLENIGDPFSIELSFIGGIEDLKKIQVTGNHQSINVDFIGELIK